VRSVLDRMRCRSPRVRRIACLALVKNPVPRPARTRRLPPHPRPLSREGRGGKSARLCPMLWKRPNPLKNPVRTHCWKGAQRKHPPSQTLDVPRIRTRNKASMRCGPNGSLGLRVTKTCPRKAVRPFGNSKRYSWPVRGPQIIAQGFSPGRRTRKKVHSKAPKGATEILC
jgi:hypothetical protein